MMRNSILWAAALLLAVSCGGGAPVTDQPADLSPYKTDSGLYTFTVKGETVQLAEMPAGTFAMGETLDMGRYRTPSIHQVILDGYAIGTTEVTQALWKAVMGSNPSPKDVPTAPVTSVTYNDVQKFLKKLSKATGVPFRLPTEAEWEYAARQREGMAGGAWEWCSDRWAEDLGYHMAINPQGPETGDQYALRGGSALEKDNKPISRKGMAPTSKASDVGLRLAVSLNAPYPQELKDVLVDNKIPREHFEAADMKPETITVNGVKFDMMPVEGGTFLMGAAMKVSTSRDDEFPPHEVTLDHFKMGKYEVTQALWEAVTGSVPYGNQGPDYPVGNVSWYDVQAFIVQLNALTGRKFRLPTEAEWEYAARGGQKTHGYAYAGSAYPQGVAQFGYDDMRTRPVARYSPNELGLYDMSGNAWEWCQDRPTQYTEEAQTNPVGRDFQPGENDLRVMRGGSVATTHEKCRVTNRNEFEPSRFRTTIGFRLVL